MIYTHRHGQVEEREREREFEREGDGAPARRQGRASKQNSSSRLMRDEREGRGEKGYTLCLLGIEEVVNWKGGNEITGGNRP